LQLGASQVQHVFDALRAREAACGRAYSLSRARLTGNIEGDGHVVCACRVGKNNPHFQRQIADVTTRFKKKHPGTKMPKFWMGHLRILGLKCRDGPGVVAVLPTILSFPGAPSVPESEEDVIQSTLFKRMPQRKSKRYNLYTDGAPGWQSALNALGRKDIKNWMVKHVKKEYTKRMQKKPRYGGSRVAGTQCIDRWWLSLDRYVPSNLRNKTGHNGNVNNNIINYIYSFVWRSNLPTKADFREELGRICK